MIIKEELSKLSKTVTAIITILGAVWLIAEPIVEDYFHEVIEEFHQEDKKQIEELTKTIDNDYHHNKDMRNEIINEVIHMYPQTRLRVEP